jgi:thiamine-monophosphate kinase
MDLSDGLADAVHQVASASGVGIELDAGALPVDDAVGAWQAARGADPVIEAVAGGDDYELLFTVPRKRRRQLAAVVRHAHGVAVTHIGLVTREPGARLRRGDRVEAVGGSFTHFGGSA